MTSHVMDLTKSRPFHIITHYKIDLTLIIRYLTYLTFSVNLLNQHFESTYAIKLLIELTVLRACVTLLS